MGLHVRAITPYALPGVLALLACWWFFSRKKDRPSTKHDPISPCVDKVEMDNSQEEIHKAEVHNRSRACPEQIDKEKEIVLQEGCTNTFSLGVHEPFYVQPYSRDEDNMEKESYLQTVNASNLQGIVDEEVVESKGQECLSANEVAEAQIDTSSVLNQSLDSNEDVKPNFDTASTDVELVCTTSTEPLCGCSWADNQEFVIKEIDQSVFTHDSQLPDMCFQTEVLDIAPKGENEWLVKEHSVQACGNEIKVVDTMSTLSQAGSVEEGLVSIEVQLRLSQPSECLTPAYHDHSQINKILCDPFNPRSNEVCDLKPANSKDVEITQFDETNASSLKEMDTLLAEAEKAGSHEVDDEIEIKGDIKPCQPHSSENILLEQLTQEYRPTLPTQSSIEVKDDNFQGLGSVTKELSEICVQSSITEVVKEGNTNLLDAFSKCLEKNEAFGNSCPIVEANSKPFLVDYEAKIVEQLAMNIISKVIVAARQEILSSSVSDVSNSSLAVEKKATENKQLASDGKDLVSAELTSGLLDFDCACESIQTELTKTDFKKTELCNELCLEHQKESHKTSNTLVHQMPSVSDFSPVYRSKDFFEDSQPALEDSGLSICTSEEALNLDDPLQSTVLSTVSIGYDSLGSSRIELSRETLNVSMRKPKNATCGENEEELYSNGDLKGGSPDLNGEGLFTAESEVDHSGGSDVNSMDSVDSGCPLGSDPFQNMTQKSDAKKADLVIWEFEVPKYLVGRLIGKQGRFVSFLKQSSGAKIYISTVPYTQDIQICHLEGSQQQIDRALNLIRKKFKDLNLTNIFAPPPPLIPLPVASWLTLPNNVSVEVVVVNVVNAGHMFVQQRTHPTFHALCGLDQHMSLCYSQPGIPSLPTPAEVGILCAAPVGPSVWWRAQVMAYFEDAEEVEILYVDYGGYNRVKIETLRQIRSDFVSLPFQGVEVLLDNVIPLGDEDHFSEEADAAVKELTRGAPMLTQVTNYDEATRLPLVQLWRLNPDEMVSVNRTLVDRGFAEWIDGY